ncbi:uncharacterized protein LOC134536191 isoform X2 [Bacillus rossius redtenbacheri]|uniref:uncharacterized protein LOC134536191 isoform X2 n=1 Tax=Bacillus rossius redtenbacheri TaxID=93214 RepID=UPI002FDCE2EE
MLLRSGGACSVLRSLCHSTAEVERGCLAALPAVLDDVLAQYERVPVARQWYAQVLAHHLPFQTLSMGFTTVDCYQQLVPGAPNLPLARTLAWCVELLGAFLAVVDDMYDGAEQRHGRPCWYRVQGPAALNDALFLHGAVFSLLRRNAARRSYYPALLHLFHQVGHVTHLGQVLDLRSTGVDGRPRWELFTDRYQRDVCRYKAERYITHLPISIALHMAGLDELLEDARGTLDLLGRLFQDDFLDAFGDPLETGKAGNDIREGRCSWVVVAALQVASPAQRARLMCCHLSLSTGEKRLHAAQFFLSVYLHEKVRPLSAVLSRSTRCRRTTGARTRPAWRPCSGCTVSCSCRASSRPTRTGSGAPSWRGRAPVRARSGVCSDACWPRCTGATSRPVRPLSCYSQCAGQRWRTHSALCKT